MSRNELPVTYRFVVLFRREPREISGASEEWRGWVRRVPDALEDLTGKEEQRVWFLDLKELPDLIQNLIDHSELAKIAGNKSAGR